MLRIKIAFACSLLSLSLTNTTLFAQDNYLHCGTTEAMKRLFEANPGLEEQYNKDEEIYKQQDKEAAARGYQETNRDVMLTVYTIPVVFHILHQNGTENISDAQVYDAVRVLNNDYRKLNADISQVVPTFTSIAADCEIQFHLAQKDPNGNCTNGIDRIFTPLTNAADDNSKLNQWPRNKYLNIWVVKTIGDPGVAGYAYLPSNQTPAAIDGIIILSTYIGSIGTGNSGTSRALTHEIGHYLNLKHTWGGTNSPGVACGVSDNVSDTPETKGHTTCALSDATCNPPAIENTQNFMEYSYCSNMFTAGQKTRMRSALTSTTSQRSSLWTTTNLAATGISTSSVLCLADFVTNSSSSNILCAGDSLKYTDISWNGNPTSWSWTFPGGTPATSTDSTPTITYNTPGIYNASLTVSNASGSVNATKTGYIRVNPSVAMYNANFYSEGYETGGAIPNADWQVNNIYPGVNTWTQTGMASSTGSKSVMITNTAAQSTYVDELISPSIDMTQITGSNIGMSFKMAYAQRTSANNDQLKVYVSTNCGKNWTLRKALIGAAMASGVAPTTSNFVPSASQWSTQTVTLTQAQFSSSTDLFVKFEFTSNGGNNIYIDDININGATGISELENTLNFAVYPNPANENTVIDFSLTAKQNVTIKVYDVIGREVVDVYKGELNAGQHKYSVAENTKLSGGVYFVNLSVGGQQFSRKLIVK